MGRRPFDSAAQDSHLLRPKRRRHSFLALRPIPLILFFLLLILITLFSLHASISGLSHVNGLGRVCLPPPPPRAPHPPLRIAMVSLSDDGGGEDGNGNPRGRSFEGLMEMVRANKEEYARKWVYDFVDARGCCLDRSRPASWSKILAVRASLPKYDWVFWNDADSIITNPEISLDNIIDSLSGDSSASPDLILTEDVNGVNAGMILVRRSSWSYGFLDRWWNATEFVQFGSTRSGDNAALAHLVSSLSPEVKSRHVRIASAQCAFNSYLWLPSLKSAVRLVTSPVSAWKGAYSPGDFMVHLAGIDDKKRWAALILQEIQQQRN